MKKLYLLFVAALLLAGGCSTEEPAAQPAASEPVARVEFRLRAAVDTETTLEPMTRAALVKNKIVNDCSLLFLRKDGQRWIVEANRSERIDAAQKSTTELNLTDDGLSVAFSLELRPGEYRVVAVLNGGYTAWNKQLVPGSVVFDADNPATVPPLAEYKISDHPANPGYRMLAREVFAAVADFTVSKSDDLHGSPLPPVELRAARRVGKMRLMLKDRPTPVNKFNFTNTGYTFRMVLRSTAPFPLGIDALGDAYYGDAPIDDLPWSLSTLGDFHPWGDSGYLICHYNSTVFSPFLFTDPAIDSLRFEIADMTLSGFSTGPCYHAEESFPLTVAANGISGMVFQTADRVRPNPSMDDIAVERSYAADGQPEDPAAFYDEFVEWNPTAY